MASSGPAILAKQKPHRMGGVCVLRRGRDLAAAVLRDCHVRMGDESLLCAARGPVLVAGHFHECQPDQEDKAPSDQPQHDQVQIHTPPNTKVPLAQSVAAASAQTCSGSRKGPAEGACGYDSDQRVSASWPTNRCDAPSVPALYMHLDDYSGISYVCSSGEHPIGKAEACWSFQTSGRVMNVPAAAACEY